MPQPHIDDIAGELRAIGHALQRLVELRPVLGLDERLAALVADDPRAMSAVANIIAAAGLIAKGLPPAERAAIARYLCEVAEELDHVEH
jgi:hypothetical protein